jgi:hypothetical protein
MTQISALDGIYVMGIATERVRVRTALDHHLRTAHNWDDAQINTAVNELELDKNPIVSVSNHICHVCGSPYAGERTYGQTLHPECAETITELAQQLIDYKKEN